MSINGKRTEITIKDVLTIAEEFAIKNPKGIIEEVQVLTSRWVELANELEIPKKIIDRINDDFLKLV